MQRRKNKTEYIEKAVQQFTCRIVKKQGNTVPTTLNFKIKKYL